MLDDVDENMSQKFKKHDLIGIPYQIIIGSKSTENKFEFKEVNSESSLIDLKDIKSKLKTKLFTQTERLIATRNLRPKRKQGFLKNNITIFLFRNNVGVVLIIVMSVMNGFRADLTDKIIGLNPHLILQFNNENDIEKLESELLKKYKEIKV